MISIRRLTSAWNANVSAAARMERPPLDAASPALSHTRHITERISHNPSHVSRGSSSTSSYAGTKRHTNCVGTFAKETHRSASRRRGEGTGEATGVRAALCVVGLGDRGSRRRRTAVRRKDTSPPSQPNVQTRRFASFLEFSVSRLLTSSAFSTAKIPWHGLDLLCVRTPSMCL